MEDQNNNNSNTTEIVKPAQPIDLTQLNQHTRQGMMLRDWLSGLSYKAIADKYGLKIDTVRTHASKHKWLKLQKEYNTRLFEEAVDQLKGLVVKMQAILAVDVENIHNQVMESKRSLSFEERAYISTNLDRLLKAISKGVHAEDDSKDTKVKNAGILVKKVVVKLPEGQTPEDVSALVPVGNVTFEKESTKQEEVLTSLEDLELLNEDEKEGSEG